MLLYFRAQAGFQSFVPVVYGASAMPTHVRHTKLSKHSNYYRKIVKRFSNPKRGNYELLTDSAMEGTCSSTACVSLPLLCIKASRFCNRRDTNLETPRSSIVTP